MNQGRIVELCAGVALAVLAVALLRPSASFAQSLSVAPSTMLRIASVSDRYQSYNVEMIEVTGGRFWRPYRAELGDGVQQPAPADGAPSGDTPAGMNADLYQYRPPIDLSNARLRKLAAALGPAYVRVSGTWANTTYFSATDTPPAAPPAGFKGVLSRAQWKGVVDFAQAVNAEIVTSFATGVGARDSAGVWTAEQATRLIDYTSAIGGRIAAAEFMNEPNLAVMGGAPAGFKGVVSRAQWKGVVDFAQAVNAEIVTSFATGAGTRDSAGIWTAEQATRLIDYTRALGGRIAAAEFMNEPNLAIMGGAPAGYDAGAYARDFKRFHAFAKAAAPEMLILGPGSVGETADEPDAGDGDGSTLKTRNLLIASRPAGVDAFS
jgi:sugar phosphate isomerase/epimerase